MVEPWWKKFHQGPDPTDRNRRSLRDRAAQIGLRPASPRSQRRPYLPLLRAHLLKGKQQRMARRKKTSRIAYKSAINPRPEPLSLRQLEAALERFERQNNLPPITDEDPDPLEGTGIRIGLACMGCRRELDPDKPVCPTCPPGRGIGLA